MGALACVLPWRVKRTSPEFVSAAYPDTKRRLYLPPGSCTVRCLTACKRGEIRHLVRGGDGRYERAVLCTEYGARRGYAIAVACDDVAAGATGLFAVSGYANVTFRGVPMLHCASHGFGVYFPKEIA